MSLMASWYPAPETSLKNSSPYPPPAPPSSGWLDDRSRGRANNIIAHVATLLSDRTIVLLVDRIAP